MAGETVGTAPCPYCRQPAGVTIMRTQRVCLTCNACKLQVFARGDDSDQRIRDTLGAPAAPAAAPAPAPAAAPAPAPAEPRRPSWGIGSW